MGAYVFLDEYLFYRYFTCAKLMAMLAHLNARKAPVLTNATWFAIGKQESNVRRLQNSSSTTRTSMPKSFHVLFIYNIFIISLLVGLLCNLKSGITAIKEEIEKH